MAKFPTYEEMAKNVAEKALDEILYQGKSIREWMQIIASEDCISRQAVLDGIEELKRSPWCTDKRGNGFEYLIAEALDVVAELCVKQAPSVNPQEPEWIPVSEGLPEDGQEILFSTKTGRVHSGKYHDDDSANQWYSHRDKCRAWNNVVIAWMPLPKPYEPQESEEKR